MLRSSILLALSLAGCGGLVCGPGTMRVGDSCLPVSSDGGGSDASSSDAGALDTGTSDAGDDAATDAGAFTCPVVMLPPSAPGAVSCIGTTCSGTDTCFVDMTTGAGSCLPPGAMQLGSAGALLRHCDEAADCGTGQVCCETFVYGAHAVATTTCESACTYGAPAQVCRTDAECGGTLQCRAYQLSSSLTVDTCHAPIGCP